MYEINLSGEGCVRMYSRKDLIFYFLWIILFEDIYKNVNVVNCNFLSVRLCCTNQNNVIADGEDDLQSFQDCVIIQYLQTEQRKKNEQT